MSKYFIVGAILLMLASVRSTAADRELTELWLEANKLFQQAKTTAQYEQVAARFETIVNKGICNGRLFYNLGNAYLKAGRVGYAILNYRRAGRYMPNDPYLKENLSYARSLVKVSFKIPERSAVLHYIFFWHYWLAPGTRISLFLTCYAVLWTILLLKLRRISLPFWSIFSVAVILTTAFAASIACDHYRETTYPPAVLVGNNVVIRKGDGSNYQPLYAKKTGAGIEVCLVESRGDWARIELHDNKHGWIETMHLRLLNRTTECP